MKDVVTVLEEMTKSLAPNQIHHRALKTDHPSDERVVQKEESKLSSV
jgi:hypothetical protein